MARVRRPTAHVVPVNGHVSESAFFALRVDDLEVRSENRRPDEATR